MFPEISWYQRSSETEAEACYIALSINVRDLEPKPVITVSKENGFEFRGEANGQTWTATFDFYAPVKSDSISIEHNDRCVRVKIIKDSLGLAYWPRLTKNPSKTFPTIKTDFDRWVDEDEQNGQGDEEDNAQGGFGDFGAGAGGGAGGFDMSMLQKMGGMGGMEGMNGMDGMDMGSLEGMDDVDADAAEEEETHEPSGAYTGKGKAPMTTSEESAEIQADDETEDEVVAVK